MRKYTFLIFFILTWAVFSPFMAFKLLCGSFVVEGAIHNPHPPVFALETDNSTYDEDGDNYTFFDNSSQYHNENAESSSDKIQNQNTPSNEQSTYWDNHNLLSLPNTEEDIFSKKDFEKITFTKNDLKAIIKELCPTVVFEGEKVISSVKRDEENRCLYITVGNSALSAESLVKRLSVPSLFFNVEETEDTVAFYPFVN